MDEVSTLFRRKCSPPPTTECLSLYELQDNNGPLAQDHSVRTPFMPCVGNLKGFRSMQNGPLRQTRTNVGDKCGSQRLKPDNTTTIQPLEWQGRYSYQYIYQIWSTFLLHKRMVLTKRSFSPYQTPINAIVFLARRHH